MQAGFFAKTSWGSGQSTSTWEGVLVVHPENRAAGTGEAISHRNRACQTPHHLSCLDLGRAQTQAHMSLCLWGLPECLNLSGLDLGVACSLGPASDSSWWSNIEPEQCGQGGYTHHVRGQAQCGWDTVITRQCYLFAASLPSPQQDWTSEPQSVHHRPLVSGQKSDTEETSKQKKL